MPFRIDTHAGNREHFEAQLTFPPKPPHLDPTTLGEFDRVSDLFC
jgi:hypothetical protein